MEAQPPLRSWNSIVNAKKYRGLIRSQATNFLSLWVVAKRVGVPPRICAGHCILFPAKDFGLSCRWQGSETKGHAAWLSTGIGFLNVPGLGIPLWTRSFTLDLVVSFSALGAVVAVNAIFETHAYNSKVRGKLTHSNFTCLCRACGIKNYLHRSAGYGRAPGYGK